CGVEAVATDPCPEGAQTDQPGATPRDCGDHPKPSPERATQTCPRSAPVPPCQGFFSGACLPSRGDAPGWFVAAPSGRGNSVPRSQCLDPHFPSDVDLFSEPPTHRPADRTAQ